MSRSQRRSWGVAALVVAVALVGAGALAWRSWPRLFAGPLERGRAAYGRRDWEAAAALARAVLKARPGDREALKLLARASGRAGRDRTADALYKRLGPDAMGAEDYFVVATCLLRQDDLPSAFRALERAHEADPDHADTLHDLSRYCAAMDRLGRAEELAERLAAKPGQEARAAVLLGAIRDRQGDPRGAIDALERALRLDPELRGLDPGPTEARKLLARNDLKIEQPGAARDRLRPLLDAGRDPEGSWLLSRAWLQEGRVAEAAAALTQASGFGSANPLAPEPAPFVGSARCAECHEEEHRAQQASRHARTFLTGTGLARLRVPDRPVPDPAEPRAIEHRVRREGGRVGWETRVDGEAARAFIEYAFGSGDRGLTPVGRDERGRFRELRLSRYGDIDGWDVTTGQPARPEPRGADTFLGRLLSPDDVDKCLTCHTTDVRSAGQQVGPLAVERGIGCERCHGPGGNHLKAMAAEFSEPAIARPRLAWAAAVTGLCSECHSPRGRTVRPTDPDAVRFQGATLPWSRCYQESRGGMSCVTCHDPHHDAETSAAHYEAKCLSCHTPAPAPAEGVRQVACPVNPSAGCLKCHMPTTTSAVLHTLFTDHHIRVHRPAAEAP